MTTASSGAPRHRCVIPKRSARGVEEHRLAAGLTLEPARSGGVEPLRRLAMVRPARRRALRPNGERQHVPGAGRGQQKPIATRTGVLHARSGPRHPLTMPCARGIRENQLGARALGCPIATPSTGDEPAGPRSRPCARAGVRARSEATPAPRLGRDEGCGREPGRRGPRTRSRHGSTRGPRSTR